MRILKFGGTSLANAKCFLNVVHILEKTIKEEKIAVVLSAPAKITNYLISSIQENLNNQSNFRNINNAQKIFRDLIYKLHNNQPSLSQETIFNNINDIFINLKKLLKQINTLKKCPENLKATIISQGEIISIYIMQALLQAKNHKTTVIDPVKTLLARGKQLDATIDILKSKDRIKNIDIPKHHIILMPGFIAGTKNKEIALLGRNGSDYSAAILAVCLNANSCEIWTDVDGIYICDPKLVPNSFLLKSILYEEALELSYFGANVLHPKTIIPIKNFNIPCLIKNTFNLKSKGTLISNNTHNNQDNAIIKGITSLKDIIIVQILNNTSNCMELICARSFSVLYKNNIDIILTSQTSVHQNINFYIFQKDLEETLDLLQKEFFKEITTKQIKPISITANVSILSIIKSNITFKNNKIFNIINALQQSSIEISAVIQSPNENTLSILVNRNDVDKGIKTIYQSIFNNQRIIEIFLIGIGGVGKALIQQIQKQKKQLENKQITLKICGILNSKLILINTNGICLNTWKKSFNENSIPFNISDLNKIFINKKLINPVVVDCSSSQNIAFEYINFLSKGFHIVTANKKANTTSMSYYKKIRETALQSNKNFLYDTNIGAGLPIIENFQKLINTGDKLIQFKGILSGSLSFIFGKIDEGMSLSEATIEAQKLGFTEPDPRDDLSGIDVARKLLILAREAGFNINLNDIIIEPILPETMLTKKLNYLNFIKKLSTIDTLFNHRASIAHSTGKVLRFIGTIQKNGKCQVKITAVDKNDPLYTVKNGENALAFYSKYYTPIPLVIRGYGAGYNVTAAGVFSDLLRII
ncbi:bifunctional aspartate kinase/homoserine dehydrogenase I [Buchnera aphidicola (Hormaphis cornu)]|nr:bifunctional aspartate kinase/homoserine dehydrogenase I [Buchnera aphidicola (Hormaphis cornu)]